jgi:predicted RNA-binding Zn-ribbon protein involved in translation (DUF1610 family)
MSSWRIRNVFRELDLSREEGRRILREAQDAAKAAGSPAAPSVIVFAFLGVMLSSAFCAAAGSVLPDSAGDLKALVNAVIIVACLAIALWHGLRRREDFLRPYVMRALNARSYGICRACGYVLRGLHTESEFCPECGTYISQRLETQKHEFVPVIRRVDQPASNTGPRLVKGIDLSAAQLEAALIEQRKEGVRRAAASRFSAGTVAILSVGILIGLTLVTQRALFPTAPAAALVIAFIAMVLVLGTIIAWGLIWRVKKKFVLDFRIALRNTGIEVCVPCGQHLGELDESATHCPECQSARETMPPPRLESLTARSTVQSSGPS